MDYLLQDFRLAFRRLRQSPGFAFAAIVTLALGIGANTVTFSAINKLLLRPLPVERPEELASLNSNRAGANQSYPNYRDLRDRNQSLAGLIGIRVAPVNMSQHGNNAHVWGYEVTGNYFDVLGVRALLGRTLTPADDQKIGAHPVVVLSYNSWLSRFAADPAIVGKSVKINGLGYTILGVTPRGFFGTELIFRPEFWVPIAMELQIEPGNPWINERGDWNLWTVGRLKRGVTQRQAESDLNAVAAQMGRETPELQGLRIYLTPPGLMGDTLRGGVIGFAAVLMGLAGLVLLIACTNLASLLLARASDRRREIALRLALGAGRWRLVRQLLAESFLLSLAGAAGGLFLAVWLVDALAAWRPPIDVPITMDFAIDRRVLAFTAAAGLLTPLLFGLAPALQAARTDLIPALKNAAFHTRLRRWHLREVLVTSQIALSVVLLIGTVLVVRSLQRALTINLGFNPRNAVAVAVDLGLAGYDETRGSEFQHRLIEKVAAFPGITSAAFANSLPLSLDQSTTSVFAEGKPVPRPGETPDAHYYMVDPGYFRAMETRLIAGRAFDQHDQKNTRPVAIVNQAFAASLFPNENALGKRFRSGNSGSTEIVGIVEDGKYLSLSDGLKLALFWPASQHYNATTTVVARSSLPASQVVGMIQQAVHNLDPTLPFYQAGSLDDHLRVPLLPARLAASMLGAFGGLAIVLAATGVYGVMAYAVARRRREIGIRIAIGASRPQVMRLVLVRTSVLLAVGTLLGVLGALAIGGQFSPILYGVSPRDPLTFALAALLMAAIAFTAAWLPARRATLIEPASALREE
ncbi:MAG: ABC transporter permease [Acidobacteriia bacterium]|nr:ABC transporter permease [Terriglobia bacterium]